MSTRRLAFLRRTLQVLLLFVLVVLVVAWFRSPNPDHFANLAWSVFLLLTIMLLGQWWGNRIAVGAFVSIVAVAVSGVALSAYAHTKILKEVRSCFKAEITASRTAGKTRFTAPEMGEILNRSVVCAEKRIGLFEAFFWNEERARNSIKVTSLK